MKQIVPKPTNSSKKDKAEIFAETHEILSRYDKNRTDNERNFITRLSHILFVLGLFITVGISAAGYITYDVTQKMGQLQKDVYNILGQKNVENAFATARFDTHHQIVSAQPFVSKGPLGDWFLNFKIDYSVHIEGSATGEYLGSQFRISKDFYKVSGNYDEDMQMSPYEFRKFSALSSDYANEPIRLVSTAPLATKITISLVKKSCEYARKTLKKLQSNQKSELFKISIQPIISNLNKQVPFRTFRINFLDFPVNKKTCEEMEKL